MNRLNRIVLGVVVLLAAQANGGERAVDTHTIAARRFTLNEAILTALQQNPDVLRARQEIERTKGLFIQLRAAPMPQFIANARFQDLDSHLQYINASSTKGVGLTGGQSVYLVTADP